MIDLTDDEQERLCEYCVNNVLGCKSMTPTFICEGSFCSEAFEMFKEDDIRFSRKEKLDKIKLDEIENR